MNYSILLAIVIWNCLGRILYGFQVNMNITLLCDGKATRKR